MKNFFLEVSYQVRYVLPIWLVQISTAFFPDNGLSVRLRGSLASLFLPGRPSGFLLGRDVTLLSIHRLKVGNRVYLAKGAWINAIGSIIIEDEVVVGPYVVMSSNNHGFKNGSVLQGGAHPAEIKIGFGSWLCAHAVVGAGVHVGSGNILGANSVATVSSSANVVLGGVPARVLKKRIDNPSSINSKHDASK